MPRALCLPLVLVLTLASGAVALAAGAVLGSPRAASVDADAVRQFYAALNAAIATGDVAALDALLAPGFVDHPAPAGGTSARTAVLQAALALHAASSDLRVEVERVAAAGDTVVVRSHLRRSGTDGAPATVAPETIAGEPRIDVFRVAGGQVAEHWGLGEEDTRCGAPVDRSTPLPAAAGVALGAAFAPAGPVWAGLAVAPDPRWQIKDAAVSADLVVAGGVVYVVGWDGTIHARDTATGAARWHFATGQMIFAPPVVGDGTVYVVAASGVVYALDAATGRERWRASAAGVVGRGLALTDETLYLATGTTPTSAVAVGVIYVARDEGRAVLQALDAATGVERWRLALADRALYAVDAATGRERWRLPLDGKAVSAPALADGAVYVAADGLYRIDAATGRVRWKADGTALPHSSPVIDHGLVYLAEPEGRLRAIEAGTGSERWAVDIEGTVVSSPVVADGVVYFGSRDGHLHAFDATTGPVCGRIALGGVVYTPVVVGGVAYVGTADGSLSAVVLPTRGVRCRTIEHEAPTHAHRRGHARSG